MEWFKKAFDMDPSCYDNLSAIAGLHEQDEIDAPLRSLKKLLLLDPSR